MEKLYVIIPIWGKSYVERFCRRGLPSLLAPNNLPGLEDRGCEWEIVFASRERDRDLIRTATRGFGIEDRIELLPIDDLMWGSYGVILTAAYAKGIKSCWKEGEDNTLMFANADFLFSDGSITRGFQRLDQGHGAVYCPSLRCVDTPALDEACDRWSRGGEEGGFSSHAMAEFAMAEPHPTVIGSVLNGIDELQRLGTHQIFWEVGDRGLIGSWFLQFMFMVRPQRPLEKLHCFVDYSLIPQLLEKGSFYSPDSSEEMFILEPTELDYEVLDINVLEQASPEKEALMIKDLSFWTTAVHRELGKKIYAVSAREGFRPPEKDLAEFRVRLKPIIDRIERRRPRDPADHYYWRVYLDRLMPWLPEDCELRQHLEFPSLSWSQRLSLNGGSGICRRLFRDIEDRLTSIAAEDSKLLTNLYWLNRCYRDGGKNISDCEMLGARLGPVPASGNVILVGRVDDAMLEAARQLAADRQGGSVSVIFLIGAGAHRLRNKFQARLIRHVDQAGDDRSGLSAFPTDLARFCDRIYFQNYLVRTIGERFRFFAVLCLHLQQLLWGRWRRWLSRIGYGKRRGRGNVNIMFWAREISDRDLDSLFPSKAFVPKRDSLK